MSFNQSAAAIPSVNDESRTSSYTEAKPLPEFFGFQRIAVQWICDQFNRTSRTTKTSDYKFASIAGWVCLGPVTYVGNLWVNGKLIWNMGGGRAEGETSREHLINAGDAGFSGDDFRLEFFFGTTAQGQSSYLTSGTGQDHPASKGIAWVLLKSIGKGNGTDMIPNIEIEVGRAPDGMGSYGSWLILGKGAPLMPSVVNVLRGTRNGLAMPDRWLNIDRFVEVQQAMDSGGVSGRTQFELSVNPMWSEEEDAGSVLSTLLENASAYLILRNGKLEPGYMPGKLPSGPLPTIKTEDIVDSPQDDAPESGPCYSSVTVVYKDPDRQYEDTPATYTLPHMRRRSGRFRTLRLDRPDIRSAPAAALVAASEAINSEFRETTGSVEVWAHRAVRLDGTPLEPGDLVHLQYDRYAVDYPVRIVEIEDDGGLSVEISWRAERGIVPTVVSNAVPAVVAPVDPDPVAIDHWRLLWLPDGASDNREMVALVERPIKYLAGFNLYMGLSSSGPWQVIQSKKRWALRGTLTAGITAAATTLTLSANGVDVSILKAQNLVEQKDNAVFVLVGDELMSLGTVSVLSPGIYQIGVLRARANSVAATAAAGAEVWVWPSAESDAFTHQTFSDVRIGGAFNASQATRYFKVSTFSDSKEGTPGPTGGVAYVLPDIGADYLVGSYTVALSQDARTVACDSGGTPLSGELGAGGRTGATVTVLRGNAVCTGVSSGPSGNQFAISLTATGCTVQKVGNDKFEVLTMTADIAQVRVDVALPDSITIPRIYSIVKAKNGAPGSPGTPGASGAPGANAKLAVLTSDAQTFQYPKGGGVSPGVITFTAFGQNLSGGPVFTVESGEATLVGTTGLTRTLPAANMVTDFVIIRLDWDGCTDRISVTKVREGTDGAPGTPGSPGSPGAPGAPATSYWMIVSPKTISKSPTGAFSSPSFEFQMKSQTGSSSPAGYPGRYVADYSTDGTTWSNIVTMEDDMPADSSMKLYPASFPGVKLIRVRMYPSGGGPMLQEETVNVIQEAGTSALLGSVGDAGGVTSTTWAIVLPLSITITVPAGTRLVVFTGNVSNASGSAKNVAWGIGVDGAIQVDDDTTLGAGITGPSFTMRASVPLSAGVHTFAMYAYSFGSPSNVVVSGLLTIE